MRQRLNDNPLFAMAFLGVLGVVVIFLFMSRSNSAAPAATPATATTPAAPGATAAPTTPAPATTAAPTTPAAVTPVADTGGGFKAGPGLPAPVVKAYQRGEVVALLVVKGNGIDDRAVRKALKGTRGEPNVAIFETYAQNVARYSRIAQGVDLNRVPALVLIRPASGTNGMPQAMVQYGFGSADNVAQSIRDAAYKGPNALPYYPR
ncbi:MAG: hypothetical protein QOF23_1887 [Solirubrobacterales bacterium]|nr:hypothetical protein [Solirubrobacterales bacterium]